MRIRYQLIMDFIYAYSWTAVCGDNYSQLFMDRS
nr:MAG TPA: hypothetical protein [Caudoviricetes sp.]